MSINFFVKTTPTPPEEEWQDASDDNFWQCWSNCSAWNGSEWTTAGPGMTLVVKGGETWYFGFRPTKMRIPGTYSYTDTVDLRDGLSGNTIGSAEFSGGTQVEFELDWQYDNDMIRLDVYPFDTVTKIEFLGGTFGTEFPPS